MPDPRIFQIHGIHQVVQGDVGVAATQTRKQRSKKPHEGVQRFAAKGTEEQIKPHHIGL